jgi:amidase
MGRRVEDVASALEAVAGYDPLDPRQRRETPDRLEILDRLDVGVSGLRIGLLAEGFDGAEAEIAEAVRAACDVLVSCGAVVERVSVPEHQNAGDAVRALMPEGALGAFQTGLYGAFSRTFYPGDLAAALNGLRRDHPEIMNPRTVLACLVGEASRVRWSGRLYAKAQNVRRFFTEAYDRALERIDILAMPTTPTTAPIAPLPRQRDEELRDVLGSPDTVARNTQPFNFTGHPALALPCARVGGLPASIQLVGRSFEDATLLRAAFAFQSSVPWDALVSVS